MSDDEKIGQLKSTLSESYQAMEQMNEQPWSPQLVGFLGISILIFCLLVLWISAHFMKGRDFDITSITKLVGLTLILCLSAFLMIVGYGQEQLTPIVGLFGAIAGYLLGKEKPAV